MPKLHLKVQNGISPPLEMDEGTGGVCLRVPSEECGTVTVTISAEGDKIESQGVIEVDEKKLESLKRQHARCVELRDELQAAYKNHVSPTDVKGAAEIARLEGEVKKGNDFTEIFAGLREASRSILRLIRQELDLVTHNSKATMGGSRWSLDGETWHSDPQFMFITGATISQTRKLDDRRKKRLQAIIDSGEQPLVGLEFLHEAWRHGEGRVKWVLATTAAELAIKQALIMLNGSLATLLLEVPAPPMHKLYGKVLDDASENDGALAKDLRKELARGAERRNAIVHKPESIHLDPDEVHAYLQHVGAAIHRLHEIIRTKNGIHDEYR
ncbi:hypothetical protein FYK55_07110 [Roseiconus nitratireducens]|uniref:Uncharacterized protein n=1 Tax=Roseiconus nitratireducens TaxID=2605748 RepID=A0A5M6DDD4_9BACT|nr:hypothetical protein [Roseiconus nitratireducens]KAA5545413.1 hypothetical protein FYK55_07110 [Roseiconus nitratireducens]